MARDGIRTTYLILFIALIIFLAKLLDQLLLL
jgi:hypothetical protein